MPKSTDGYERATAPFVCQGEKQFVTVESGWTVRRRSWKSKAVVDETTYPTSRSGCSIEEIAASPSGKWLVAERSSGQGDWGYEVFRTCPLKREAGISQERGYMLELPQFSADETRLVGGFGRNWLGGWWAHPDDEREEPARGGLISFGFLLVHRLPSHRVKRHELRMDIPQGWLPDEPETETWYAARAISPVGAGVRLTLPGGVEVDIEGPLKPVILLPTPHPSGKRLLSAIPKGVKVRRTKRRS